MNIINPIIYLSNKIGIPRIQSNSVTVSTTNIQFSFSSSNLFSSNFAGLVLVKLNQSIPAGTTTTLPIVFTSPDRGTQSLLTYNGAEVTVDNLPGTGIYLCYFDKNASTLQVISGLTA